MGSFPNIVASQLLKAIFVTPFSSGNSATASSTVCSLYNSDNVLALNAATQGGFFTASVAGAQPLYLGLIEHQNVGANAPVISGNFIDSLIQSTSGTVTSAAWVATGSLSGTSAELSDSGYDRKVFTASLQNAATDSGALAAVQLPGGNPINFGTISNTYTSSNGASGLKGIVGFFISSFIAKTTGGGLRPHVIAYGVLSNARTLQGGDQPTFAVNAITITLD